MRCCWLCLWLWNDREFSEGNDPHFSGLASQCPTRLSICLRLFLIIRLRRLLVAFYEKKNIKFIFFTSSAATFSRFSLVLAALFMYAEERIWCLLPFCCLAFWLISVSFHFDFDSFFLWFHEKIYFVSKKIQIVKCLCLDRGPARVIQLMQIL